MFRAPFNYTRPKNAYVRYVYVWYVCMLYQGNPPIVFYLLVAILFRSAILLAYFARQIYYKLIKTRAVDKIYIHYKYIM